MLTAGCCRVLRTVAEEDVTYATNTTAMNEILSTVGDCIETLSAHLPAGASDLPLKTDDAMLVLEVRWTVVYKSPTRIHVE